MPADPSASDALNGPSSVESYSLKTWSCTNCRRRKVRCDRRYPCIPCTRNQLDCVFPTSGRMPRHSRPISQAQAPSKKQTEVVGRLRRLEAMVGELGSQVEHAAVRGVAGRAASLTIQDTAPSAPASTSTGASSLYQSPPSNSRCSADQIPNPAAIAQVAHGVEHNNLMSPQMDDEPSEVTLADNGDLILGDRFWTVFCKEVIVLIRVSINKQSRPIRSRCSAYLRPR